MSRRCAPALPGRVARGNTWHAAERSASLCHATRVFLRCAVLVTCCDACDAVHTARCRRVSRAGAGLVLFAREHVEPNSLPRPAPRASPPTLDAARARCRCKDEQTSADVSNVASFNLPANSGPKGAGGACTNALLSNVYGAETDLSWIGLLTKMQATLKVKGYTQIPQFSGSRKLDLDSKFNLVHPAGNGRLKVQ